MNAPTETQLYEDLLCSHLQFMVHCLRQIPADKWDFQFAPPAPSPRILATHAWQWLICDRYHINEPDAAKHPRVPAPPYEQQALCDALAEETSNWQALLRSLTPEMLGAPRSQFNQSPMTVRAFVGHILQNTIYKNGQFTTIYYALGLDGSEPYTAPFPNPIYEELFGNEATEFARD